MSEVQLRVGFHHAAETLIAFPVGRHHQSPRNLQHHRPSPHSDAVAAKPCGIDSHGASRLCVVAADIGRVGVGGGLALEEDHGNALLLGLLHAGREGLIFVGRDDKQVHTGLDEAVDLPPLHCGVVVRVGDADLHVCVIEVLCREHFVVHLVAPTASDTLRHTYLIFVGIPT